MKHIALLLPHDYKLWSVASVLDVLESVNKLHNKSKREDAFRIQIVQTPQQIFLHGKTFFGYPVKSISAQVKADIILIPSFTTSDLSATLNKNVDYLPWLQKQFKAGAEIASFCTGALLFAASGLLNGKLATTHVDECGNFVVAFPSVFVKPGRTFTVDGRCYTSGGATSSFHLLVFLIQKYCGNEFAIRISKIFAIDPDRYKQSYFSTFKPNYAHHDELVMKIQKKLETNYLSIHTIEEVIKDLPASRRNIVRRFKQLTGTPPIEYLQHIRIETAKQQLERTNRSISEIISETGYTDPKSFRKVFLKLVGMTPLEYRDKFKMM